MRTDLNKGLKKVISQIKGNSKDAKFADKLIEQLLSIKGQLDVKPVELIVESDTVLYRHHYGNYELIKTENEYIYATTGYRIIVKPYSLEGDAEKHIGLYHWFNVIMQYQEHLDNGKKLNKQEQEIFDSMLFALDAICKTPLIAFISENCLSDVVGRVSQELVEKVKEAAKNLPKDDDTTNQKFKEQMLANEKLKEQLEKEMEEK